MSRAWAFAMLAIGVALLVQLVRFALWDFRSTESKRDVIRRTEQRRLRKAARGR
jgi:hypothetical protein